MAISSVSENFYGAGKFGYGKISGIKQRTKINVKRPSDWLPEPDMSNVSDGLTGIFAVFNSDSNFIAFTASGAYTVNWGDGTVENFAAGATAQHNYSWSSISSSTLTSAGFRQAVISITPQPGNQLTSINLNVKHSSYTSGTTASNGVPSTAWLDILIKAPALTSLTISAASPNTSLRSLRYFSLISSAITSAANLFYSCYSLRSVRQFNTGTLLSTNNMFIFCNGLVDVCYFNTASVQNMSGMFQGCTSLRQIPTLNTSSATNMGAMFNGCVALETVPKLNTSAATAMYTMFSGCSSLISIPNLDTANNTNMNSMFYNCYSLRQLPNLNTGNVLYMSSTFQGCQSLETIPLLNTSKVTDMSSMFYGCYSLTGIPLLNTSSVTNTNSMFAFCYSLQSVPLLNMSNVTNANSMFNNCTSLQEIPELVTSSVSAANYGSIFMYCSSLQKVSAVIYQTTNLTNCKLSATALNAIYTSLPSKTATLSVTGNWGTSSDNPSIATSKGWTITG